METTNTVKNILKDLKVDFIGSSFFDEIILYNKNKEFSIITINESSCSLLYKSNNFNEEQIFSIKDNESIEKFKSFIEDEYLTQLNTI